MFRVIGTDEYLKRFENLNNFYQRQISKYQKKFSENPYVGKPLGYSFLREKRVNGKRIYYLVYEDLKLVLLIAISDKKDQQKVINTIRMQLKDFRTIAESISKQFS